VEIAKGNFHLRKRRRGVLRITYARGPRKGLEGREAAAQAAEPPESPVCGVLRRKCAKIPDRNEITNEFWNRLRYNDITIPGFLPKTHTPRQ
jgi:hypothetical protein